MKICPSLHSWGRLPLENVIPSIKINVTICFETTYLCWNIHILICYTSYLNTLRIAK